nr:ABC transporter substrate-binding protein [Candidatus Palauibacterales bacterium]
LERAWARARAPRRLLVLATLVAWGCGGGETGGGTGAPRTDSAGRGGTVVVAARAEIPGVNPLVAPPDYFASQIERYVLLMPLVQLGPDLQPEPWLARSWDLRADSSQVVFHLRDDVKWQDGQPVTAGDVAFTFRKAKDPDVPFPNRAYFDRWDSVKVEGPHTVRFWLRPYSQFLFGWTQVPIVPEHVLGDVPDSALASASFNATSPVGDGPFRFVIHEQGDRWVFEANPDFPADLGGPPRVDRIVYRIIPDESTELTELERGDVDLYLKLPPDQLSTVRADTSLDVLTFPSPTYAFVAWNTRRSMFSDARVRRALTMAMNRRQILQTVQAGLGSVATGPLGPWHWAYDTAWRPIPYAPDSARALLAAAGWTDTDGDGVVDLNGRPFRFELLTNPSQTRQDIAVMLQADLARVGVDLVPRTREMASLGQAIQSSKRLFDAFLLSWTEDMVIDDRDYWACDRRDDPLQFSGYCDPTLDAIMDSIPRALDRDRKRRLLRRYAEMVEEAQPFTFLYNQDGAVALRRSLRGVSVDVRGELRTAARWWLVPRSR